VPEITLQASEKREGVQGGGNRLPTALTLAAAVGVLILDAATPIGLAVWVLHVVIIWTATLWADRRQMLTVASVCSAFVLLGFWWSPRERPDTWMDYSNLLLCYASIWGITYASLQGRAAEEARQRATRELAQSEETVRILSGLLPICAWCKNIRNEAGDWEKLEVYIRDRSHAEFTHCVCQECSTRILSGEKAS
jgi:hypothetical protein